MNPGAPFADRIASLRTWALLARSGLGANFAVDLLDLTVRWGTDVEHVNVALLDFTTVMQPITLLLTMVFFLRWIYLLVRETKALGASVKWRPAQAVTGFFIPILSIVRPYQVVRDTQLALALDAIAEPPPRVEAAQDYRSVKIIPPAPPKAVPKAHLGLWWGSFLVSNFFAQFSANTESSGERTAATFELAVMADALLLVSAVLAFRVVWRLTALLDERYRRICHSTPEELKSQRIRLRP